MPSRRNKCQCTYAEMKCRRNCRHFISAWKRGKKEYGFTLLEVLLTIVLISGGFIALLQAVSAGLFAGAENESELIAINLAQEKMEELRNKSYVNIINETKAAVSGFSAFQREVAVSVVQTGLKRVNVNVYWYVKSAEISAGLTTYVSDI